MISEIRVKARAASMEEAEREIEILLDHARMAGFLEGIVPSSSSVADDHYGEVRQRDRWIDLDPELRYEGRVVLGFDPERVFGGGLKQFGYVVTPEPVKAGDIEAFPPHADCGHMVLARQQPVTREHTWEGSSAFGYTAANWDENGQRLATFNRPRHETRGNYDVSVWLRGVDESERDRPTNVYGVVSDVRIENGPALFEYSHDLKDGETVDEIVEQVYEKIGIYADALVRVGDPVGGEMFFAGATPRGRITITSGTLSSGGGTNG